MMKSADKDTPEPLVSICIPTYNSASYLRETLDSVVAQTYKNVEVIIADNASTDETVAIVREYAGKYGFRLVVNPSNLGPLNNWNLLVSLATGKYVAIYHSDDVYEEEIVAESVQILEQEPEVALVGTLAQVIDGAGNDLFRYELPLIIQKGSKRSYCFDEVLAAVLGSGDQKIFLITPSLMVRAAAYHEAGKFDEEAYKSSGDYEMWLRIARRHRVAVIDRPLMRYRVHSKQGSEAERQKVLQVPDIIPVLGEYGYYANDRRVRKQCERFVARRQLAVAIKLNRSNRFVESSRIAAKIGAGIYRLAAWLLIVSNGLKIRFPAVDR